MGRITRNDPRAPSSCLREEFCMSWSWTIVAMSDPQALVGRGRTDSAGRDVDRPIFVGDGRARERLRASKRHDTAVLPISRQDRKSTRLNSSHMSISYAVFCLKKKKK